MAKQTTLITPMTTGDPLHSSQPAKPKAGRKLLQSVLPWLVAAAIFLAGDGAAKVTGHTLAAAEVTMLRDTLYHSLSAIIAGVALTDPSFAKVAQELSKAGAVKLGIV